jgi:hypothetical protein
VPTLYDSKGTAIKNVKENKQPKFGNAFGNWAGRDFSILQLANGSYIQFDLSKLTLSDYRAMIDHYQINSSLAVLSFIQHQSEWYIEHDDKKMVDLITYNLKEIWTQLTRGMAQANWSGFSPNVLDWDNGGVTGHQVVISRVKDLLPEECLVHWKQVEGYAPQGQIPPKFKSYDGIFQFGQRSPIPVENSFWYPLLMENGNYYGRKLLKSAYTSYFFSILMHLYANRYYERFGEPTPVGRAPFDDIQTINGQEVNGQELMLNMLSNLRNRGVITLPSDTSRSGGTNSAGSAIYDYSIDFLESQMRGADWERYMQRLDEEMTLALFTPLLLLRTADVGSYNLGQGHMQLYLWMLNAINDDRAQYINKYIIRPIWLLNRRSQSGTPPKIIFNQLGNKNTELVQILLQALVSQNKVDVDLAQLGQLAGLNLSEVRQLTPQPQADPNKPEPDPNQNNNQPSVNNTVDQIKTRMRSTVENAFKSGKFNENLQLSVGYKKHLERALAARGMRNPSEATNEVYRNLDVWNKDMCSIYVKSTDEFMDGFSDFLDYQLQKVGVSDGKKE